MDVDVLCDVTAVKKKEKKRRIRRCDEIHIALAPHYRVSFPKLLLSSECWSFLGDGI
jgi:hypothetical protein